MKRLIPIVVIVAAIAGCATSSSGVVALSDGQFRATRQGASAGVSTHSLRAAATQAAAEHCAGVGKPLRVIDTRQKQARFFGGWPEAEVLFRCE